MLRQVREIFEQIANHNGNADGSAIPNMRIRMSGLLYNYHLNLYRECHVMLNQQDRVLNDGEHRSVIEEGTKIKLRMPHMESFRLRVMALRANLDSYNPRDIVRKPGDTVEISLQTARAMHATMLLTTSYIYDYFLEMKRSDYLRWLRHLKKSGAPYAGPGSLLEVFNAYVILHSLAAQMQAECLPARLPPNWTRRPASRDNYRDIPDPGAHIDVRALLVPPSVK